MGGAHARTLDAAKPRSPAAERQNQTTQTGVWNVTWSDSESAHPGPGALARVAGQPWEGLGPLPAADSGTPRSESAGNGDDSGRPRGHGLWSGPQDAGTATQVPGLSFLLLRTRPGAGDLPPTTHSRQRRGTGRCSLGQTPAKGEGPRGRGPGPTGRARQGWVHLRGGGSS